MANVSMPEVILDSLNDGLYVCDRERRIIFWSKSAERITGWAAADVVGHRCQDNILCHVDKDGRCLCGEEFCPLHRSMVTDRPSNCPVIIVGQGKNGNRIPMVVSVAPLHNETGTVVGGVETFHDISETYSDLERAKRIQTLSLDQDLPHDNRVAFTSIYLPHDMIGGDYFAIRKLTPDKYGFFIADVMGHGVAAALHTMHLSSLWNRYCHTLTQPAEFARQINRELCRVVRDESFATAICGILDAGDRSVRIASAGGPSLLLIRANGRAEEVGTQGLPFGMIENAEFDECRIDCAPGDCLLLFTDGAVEIQDSHGQMLGPEGLIGLLPVLGYPETPLRVEPLQQALLSFSNGIRLEDDLTLLEIRFS
ncbi:phosphoserine phosphatase RsbP [Geobacter sp. OR-1]|uniref:SpoIIE family protein phosphatase n=1 Tax=Geobacter sp. OR-1 TaxID=1266765 RepID=UPI0005438758|nr:SpoIIE family protein phosphatase [Geobacter sp. OR-1]GAM11030.1 phosphoserine phosphatase RsbP [Geobacter sp. OR-1]